MNLNDDSIPAAQYALVFMIVCIKDFWKVPVAYYLIHSLCSDERSEMINRCLEQLHSVGAKVVTVTADGAASNLAIFKKSLVHV